MYDLTSEKMHTHFLKIKLFNWLKTLSTPIISKLILQISTPLLIFFGLYVNFIYGLVKKEQEMIEIRLGKGNKLTSSA